MRPQKGQWPASQVLTGHTTRCAQTTIGSYQGNHQKGCSGCHGHRNVNITINSASYRKRAGRTYRVVKPKPYTTALVREARIAFSILRLKDNQNEMTRRLYLDEKVFVMGAGKKSVWVKPYEEVPTRQRRKIH